MTTPLDCACPYCGFELELDGSRTGLVGPACPHLVWAWGFAREATLEMRHADALPLDDVLKEITAGGVSAPATSPLKAAHAWAEWRDEWPEFDEGEVEYCPDTQGVVLFAESPAAAVRELTALR